jgi:outer membrane protein insertion porin family
MTNLGKLALVGSSTAVWLLLVPGVRAESLSAEAPQPEISTSERPISQPAGELANLSVTTTPAAIPAIAPTVVPTTVPTPTTVAAAGRPSTRAQDLAGLAPLSQGITPPAAGFTVVAQATPQRFRRSAFYFGSQSPDPSVLVGPSRETTVAAADPIRSGFSLTAGGQINFRPNQQVNLEVRGGESVLGAEASYFIGSRDPRRGLNLNVFSVQSYSPSFRSDDRTVTLPAPFAGTENPIVDRMGGGVQWLQPLASKLDGAFGLSYQRVAIREDLFSNRTVPFDQFGNRLSVSSRGVDDLLTLGAALRYDTRDFAGDPTRGTHLRFGVDQAIPVGNASINMTRLSAGAAQFIPLSRRGPHTLVVSAQGGTILGDVPPYEAFNLGGMNTVRGYGQGELGTGSSFVQASLEYRFPLFGFKLMGREVKVRGVVFGDYGNTLGTQDDVIGRPGDVRDKPGNGFGGGLGARVRVGPALARIEVGVSDQGDLGVYFGFGERF